MEMAPMASSLPWLKKLHSLDAKILTGLPNRDKLAIIHDIGEVCRHLMEDLGVKWKAQPVDQHLRDLTIEWIKLELEPEVGRVSRRFLLSTDAGLTYTERVYENGDFNTKLAMVKYVTLAIFLDDLIDKNATVARKAESFLFDALNGFPPDCGYLDQYKRASIHLASCMSDPLAENMLLHSCTTFIEGCVLEYRNGKASGAFFEICDALAEHVQDDVEVKLAKRGHAIPRPLGTDRIAKEGHLVPHCWPTWLRQKSAVAETFTITTFRPPGEVDLPIHLWISAVPEMRTLIMYINDLLSFAKELLAEDAASYLTVVTNERRHIGMSGTALDGSWCLRDTIEEVYSQTLSAGGRINRILRPKPEARYRADGNVRSIAELVSLLKDDTNTHISKDEVMRALSLVLWETHQKGYVSWHFQSQRYRTSELFSWVQDMAETKASGAEWITSNFI